MSLVSMPGTLNSSENQITVDYHECVKHSECQFKGPNINDAMFNHSYNHNSCYIFEDHTHTVISGDTDCQALTSSRNKAVEVIRVQLADGYSRVRTGYLHGARL